jgi:ABC-type transport system substrate-binding protein
MPVIRSRPRGLLRSRLTYQSAAVAACIVGITALAACGSGSPSESAAVAAASGASGTLNWEWELPTSWDPVTSSAGWDMHVLGLVYASITTLNAKGDVQPGLASSWKYAADGKSVTFTLRPGLKFSDGSPLTATSVKENIQRGLTQSNSTVASELSVISKVTVASPTSFTLDLSQVDYQVPDLLAGKDGMIVNPAYFKNVASLATKPEGAGPFALTSYVPDSHANLVRNADYWDASQVHIANFNVLSITQPEQILSALESGQVNVAYIAGNQVAAAKAAGFKIDVIPSEVVNELDIQTTTAPFNNPKVVEAINYAINRQAILQVQASGYGSVAYQPFPAGFVGYSAALANLYPYNPAKARQLLTSHGWNVVPGGVSTCTDPSLCGPGIKKGQPLNFSFVYATGTQWVASEMTQLQSNASGVGIKLNLVPKVPTQVGEIAGGNCVAAKLPCNWDMANYGGAWTFFPDYLPTGEDLFICGAIPDSSGFCNKTDDAMIEKTLTSSNLSYMYQWQDYLAPLLPQMWQPLADYQLTEVSSNLRGVTPQMPTIDILPENWYFVK